MVDESNGVIWIYIKNGLKLARFILPFYNMPEVVKTNS